MDISHNGAIAASSSLDAHIRLWDLESGKQIKSMDAGPGKTGLPGTTGTFLNDCLCLDTVMISYILLVFEL